MTKNREPRELPVNNDLADVFKDAGDNVTKDSMTLEMHEYLMKAQKLTEEQDMLEIFFEIMSVLYLNDKIDSFVKLMPSEELPEAIRFRIAPVLNEVLASDKRNRNYLIGVKRSDVEYIT